jgi:hypothetical protein
MALDPTRPREVSKGFLVVRLWKEEERGGHTLVLLKGLLHLLHVGKVPDVGGDVHRRGAEAADGVGDVEVDLAGVGLNGDVVDLGEAGLFAEELVEPVNLGAVAVEDLEEGGLGWSRWC